VTGIDISAAIGFVAYCGTFEVREGQAVQHMEFGVLPSMSGVVEPRSVVLDGDRLIQHAPNNRGRLEWQRVRAYGESQ
jgi:hypothetical protein